MLERYSIRGRIVLVLSLMVFLAGGCSGRAEGQLKLPDDGPPVRVSQEAAVRFAQKALSSTSTTDSGGVIRFTITQEEATSALAIGARLASYSQGGPLFEGIPELEGMAGSQDLKKMLESQGEHVLQASDLPPQIQDLVKNFGKDERGGVNLPDLRLKLEEPQVYFKSDGRIILRGYGILFRWRIPMRLVVAPRASQGELQLDFLEGQLGALPMPGFLFDPLGNLLAKVLLAGREYAAITELTVRAGSLSFSGRLSLDN